MDNKMQQLIEDYCNKIIAAGEELRHAVIPQLTKELFSLYEETGNRLKYEDVYFRRRKFLAVFGMLSILYKREEDIHKLEEILRDICLEECWALPPHVNPKEDKNWRITIDLFASETAQAVTEIISLLDKELSVGIKELVRGNVERRVIHPFYESDIPYGNWEHCHHNWCGVCAGSIGSASIYLYREEPKKLNQYLTRICDSLTHYIAGFPEDGTCMEGIGYFTYGMTYYTTFAEQVREYTSGKIDLFQEEKLEKIAQFQQKCYFEEGFTVNFSDGSNKERFKLGLTSYLALRFPSVYIPNLEQAAGYDTDPCFRWAAIYRDYIWTKRYSEEFSQKITREQMNHTMVGQIVLPSAQWSINQSKNGAGFAIKGGHNDEPHNHNDIGSFLYVYKKDMLLAELGAGEYTKDYFNENRYNILCNSSLGHSVPRINHRGQLAGKKYSCNHFATNNAGITNIEIGGAYDSQSIESIQRLTHFNLENGEAVIEDIFKCNDRTIAITENLVTCYQPVITGNIITIEGGYNTIIIKVDHVEGVINTIEEDHKDHSGNLIKVYLIQWEVPIKGITVSSKFVITPKE